MQWYKKIVSHTLITPFVFSVLVGVMSLMYFYPEILTLRPQSIHQWRQCDCLSITMNYYKENRSFFQPSMHYRGDCGNGKAVAELPIIYYLVAQLWKVFGYHEYIFRMLDTCILFAGLFALHKMCYHLIKNTFWSIYIPLLFFTSPILVYYGNNFTADVPALSLTLIGWCFFWYFFTTSKNYFFYLSLLFFAFGVLLKASAVLSLIILSCCFLFDEFRVHRKKIAFVATALLMIAAWYTYASYYSRHNNYNVFLLGTMPVWQLDTEHFIDTFRLFLYEILPQFFNPFLLPMVLAMLFIIFIARKSLSKFLQLTIITYSLGFMAFLILFFQVFNVHDYYLINMLPLVVFIVIAFTLLVKIKFPRLFNQWRIKLLATLLLIFCAYSTSQIQKAKYFGYDRIEDYSPLLTPSMVASYSWLHYNYDQHLLAIESIEPYLRSIGIKRDDLVYSTPDPSFNISLYLMDQHGFTDYNCQSFNKSSAFDEAMCKHFVQERIKRGAHYLILNDTTKLKMNYLKPFTHHKIGQYLNVEIFDLQR